MYYGHRYYEPRTGRFLGRGPLGEAGGSNLYGFVRNNPVNRSDFLGMYDWYYEGPDGQMYSTMPHITDSPGDFLAMDRESALRSASRTEGTHAIANQMAMVESIQAANASANLNAILSSTAPGAAAAMRTVALSNTRHLIGQLALAGYGSGNAPAGLAYVTIGSLQSYGSNSAANHVGSLTASDIAKAALSGITIKGGADIGYYVGSSATVSRPVTDATGGKAAVDATIGGGAIAYAGFEGKVPLFQPGSGRTFSFGGTVATGLALGGSLELEIRGQSLLTIFGTEVGIRYFVPTSINPFLGIGFGGSLKLEKPTPSATLIEVNVNQSGNTTTGGLLGGRRP